MSDWANAPIRSVVEDKETWNPRKDTRKYVEYLEIAGVDNSSGQIISTRRIEVSSPPSRAKRVIRKGDVVFGTTRPYLKNIAVVPENLDEQVCSTGFCVLRPDHKKVITEWLFSICRSDVVVDQVVPGQEKNAYPAVSDAAVMDSIIPVPPLNEQCRIVARIEELTHRAETAGEIAIAREAEFDMILQSLYSRLIDGAEWKPLLKIASLVRRAIKTKTDEQYEEMGIRSFGKGTFKKPVLTCKQIGNKRIYRIHEGDLVFNNVFAWEKAIAVAKKEDQGRVGSHRFITYVPYEGMATSEFLCHHFLNERGIEDIRAASPGSAGRNRTLGLKKLEKILVPVPDYEEQKRFAEIAKRRQLVQKESAGIAIEMKLFTAALLAKAFRGEL